YRASHRELQDRFDTRRLADRLDERIVHDRLTDKERAYIEHQDMFFLPPRTRRDVPTAPTRAATPASCVCSTSTPWPSRAGMATACTSPRGICSRTLTWASSSSTSSARTACA